MKEIPIYIEDILPSQKKLQDSKGRLDLLGQILKSGYNISIDLKAKTPACQETLLYPFTCLIRGVVCNTQLTMDLLSSTTLSPTKQVNKANKLLLHYQIKLLIK